MREYIHFRAIEKFYEENFHEEIEDKTFNNEQTGEVYHIFASAETDIAFFTVGKDGEHICLDSDGEAVNQSQIYGYINGEYTAGTYAETTYRADKLHLSYQGQEVERNALIKYDVKMYPERTNIVLNAMFTHNGFTSDLTSFYIDEVVYADNEKFAEIQRGDHSELLKQYNEKNYETVSDSVHGIAVIGNHGDGLLVDTQGYDYARYLCYAPQIARYITERLEIEMEQKAKIDMNLYVPLKVTAYDGEYDEEYEVEGGNYFRMIQERIRLKNMEDGKRGLAAYMDDGKIKEKVYQITPAVGYKNGKLMGIAKIKLTESLELDELKELKAYCIGQFTDGWGEGFERREISTGNGNIYVHFWDHSDDYFIKTEDEMDAMTENQKMQGMNM